MLFNSLDFLVFFPVVTLLYFLLPHRLRWLLLLVASCIFYMYFIPVYLLILVFTIIVDYIAGIAIENAPGVKRKIFLIISLVANIGGLVIFKYAGWLHPAWKVILPLGLSFHTFQAMSYTIEVYRGRQAAERHPGIYALYVMFYPQLVAGPIERPSHLLPQLSARHSFNWGNLAAGLRLMLWGFFKKLVIADRLSGYVNYVYDHAGQLSYGYVIVAVVFFSFQVYCDFSGYSDIATGAAKTMGFDLMVNFNRPYFSTNIREFWSRWHISLTSWFRDYVYIPLGGNRAGKYRKYFNILAVFLLSGLWHGAGWNFLIWGGLHAMLMIGWVWRRDRRPEGDAGPGFLGRMGGIALTFCLVTLAWVFFRCTDLGQALQVLGSMLGQQGDPYFNMQITRSTIGLGFIFIILLLLMERFTSPRLEEWRGRFWPDIAFGALTLTAILLFGVFSGQSFIYFQF